MWPKHEIVPYLLASLPRLTTLGHINVLRGLKMIRDIPALNGISAESLEEIDFYFGGSHYHKLNSRWADDDDDASSFVDVNIYIYIRI